MSGDLAFERRKVAMEQDEGGGGDVIGLAAFDGGEAIGLDLVDLAAHGASLSGAYFEDCTFTGCTFDRLTLDACEVQGCTFEDCDLARLQVPSSKFLDTRFIRCRLAGVDWTQADWPSLSVGGLLSFDRCDLEASTFMDLDLPELSFVRSRLTEVDFSGASIGHSSFAACDLAGAIFNGTDLQECDLSSAVNYAIDHRRNVLTRARFSLPEAAALLRALDIVLVEPVDDQE